jgi:hypothetical protein
VKFSHTSAPNPKGILTPVTKLENSVPVGQALQTRIVISHHVPNRFRIRITTCRKVDATVFEQWVGFKHLGGFGDTGAKGCHDGVTEAEDGLCGVE